MNRHPLLERFAWSSGVRLDAGALRSARRELRLLPVPHCGRQSRLEHGHARDQSVVLREAAQVGVLQVPVGGDAR